MVTKKYIDNRPQVYLPVRDRWDLQATFQQSTGCTQRDRALCKYRSTLNPLKPDDTNKKPLVRNHHKTL